MELQQPIFIWISRPGKLVIPGSFHRNGCLLRRTGLFKDDFTQILDCIMQVPPLQLNQVAQIRGVIKDGPCKVMIVPPRALLDPL